jgi:recombination protein RecT
MAANLAARVKSNAVAQRNPGTNTLEQDIKGMTAQFELAMPKGAEAAQLVRDAITALRMTPKLAQCDSRSVLGSLMTCAQLGLRPGVLGHAWLLPFWSSKANDGRGGFQAQLIIGYQGLIELAHRSGRIASLIARTVYENDHLDIDYGLADSLVHRPTMSGERGEPRGYYAFVKFNTGGHAFLWMTHDDMVAYSKEHATAKTKQGVVFGPWKDHFEGMAHKTMVRQLSKWMPKSTEMATAIAADNTVRLDIDPKADINHVAELVGEVIVEDTEAGPVNTDTGEVVEEPAPVEGEIDYMEPSNADDAWVSGKR